MITAVLAATALIAAAPAPAEPLPRSAAGLAADLVETTRELRAAVVRFDRASSARRARPGLEVELWALRQQRIHRRLGERPRLARVVIRRMPARLRGSVRRNVAARVSLRRLHGPPARRLPRWRFRDPEPPRVLLGHYRAAERRFGVDWEVLAAINMIETGFGRIRSQSSAGAQGPMQFLPATWRAYGLGGDVHDPRDAIMGAANYLRASGAPRSYRRAIFAYNHSRHYVDAVLAYAREIRRDPRRLTGYWAWQVWVRTARGDYRVTGPGRTPVRERR